MVNTNRRTFLRRSGAMAVASALAACGGGTGNPGSTENANVAGEGAQATTLATSSASIIPTTPLSNASFTLTSQTSQSRAPYTLGYAFKQGDVPKGSSVTADAGTLQVIPKNSWPDGSLKFAVLSGIVDLTANTSKTINLSRVAAPATGTALNTTRLRFTNIVAEVGTNAFGSAKWSGADWDSPFATWVSGPTMSSWIYRKPIGTDKHLVAWLEVRLFSNGMVEVLPWIENGYILVPSPTNKSAHYTFSLGGTQRFSADIDLKHHQRTPLISGSALSYWLGSDASVSPVHNKAYLQSTELVPTYMAQVDNSAYIVKNLAMTYQPLQAGNFNYDNDAMGSSGYQDPIGLLPQHDVIYLTSNAPEAYGAVVRNGFSAGRYGIHYRDENTNRPLRFSSYPHLNISDGQAFGGVGDSTTGQRTPTATGGNPPWWDVAHSPSLGFLAYLITGRWYFMEEVQFATTTNYLGNGDNNKLRDGSKGLVQSCLGAWQTRSTAWDWRARVQALCVTPDDDTALRSEFIASVEANIDHFYGRYVAQKNNPFGFIAPGENYEGNSWQQLASWQQDFVTAAFGYSVSLGLPISASASNKLSQFFQWKARSAVMRLGSKSGFWYINAVPYGMMISPSPYADFNNGTGPWYQSDAEVYAATYANKPAWLGNQEGVLAAEYMPGETALWGNIVPAIAYAVRHGVPGAQEAYNRMVGASNWGTVRNAFNAHPVWSIQPSTVVVAVPAQPPAVVTAPATGTPSWLAGAAVGQWVEIQGTGGAGGSAVFAYCGIAFNEKTNEIIIPAAGGHGDSDDNRVVSLRLTDNSPTWTQRHVRSTITQRDVSYYQDGMPTSRHLYKTAHYVPQYNKVVMFGIFGAYGSGWSFPTMDAFDMATNNWDPRGTWADAPSGNLGVVMERATGVVWSNRLGRWSPETKTWTQPITQRSKDLIAGTIAHDSKRNQLFTLNWGDDWGYSVSYGVSSSIVPCNGSVQTSITYRPSAALSQFMVDQPSYAALDYDPDNDRFLFYCGQGSGAGRVYVITPNASTTWDMSFLATTGKLPPATPGAGVHNRFRYVPALKGFLLMPSDTSNLFFIRTA